MNNEECLVFWSIYEFFIDVSYLLGDSERFSGFDASLMDKDCANRNIAKSILRIERAHCTMGLFRGSQIQNGGEYGGPV